eukprot:TRINITY_DN4596_c0_g1_i3.p1 TRINITY_DN4596_c0_g1~~TRINITY_DN4596_c0_g1_i3.p1  ORF type:complete len:1008 (+),score=196.57 TRINITY_DN4596_c0_g1_i3:83-3106(+)
MAIAAAAESGAAAAAAGAAAPQTAASDRVRQGAQRAAAALAQQLRAQKERRERAAAAADQAQQVVQGGEPAAPSDGAAGGSAAATPEGAELHPLESHLSGDPAGQPPQAGEGAEEDRRDGEGTASAGPEEVLWLCRRRAHALAAGNFAAAEDTRDQLWRLGVTLDDEAGTWQSADGQGGVWREAAAPAPAAAGQPVGPAVGRAAPPRRSPPQAAGRRSPPPGRSPQRGAGTAGRSSAPRRSPARTAASTGRQRRPPARISSSAYDQLLGSRARSIEREQKCAALELAAGGPPPAAAGSPRRTPGSRRSRSHGGRAGASCSPLHPPHFSPWRPSSGSPPARPPPPRGPSGSPPRLSGSPGRGVQPGAWSTAELSPSPEPPLRTQSPAPAPGEQGRESAPRREASCAGPPPGERLYLLGRAREQLREQKLAAARAERAERELAAVAPPRITRMAQHLVRGTFEDRQRSWGAQRARRAEEAAADLRRSLAADAAPPTSRTVGAVWAASLRSASPQRQPSEQEVAAGEEAAPRPSSILRQPSTRARAAAATLPPHGDSRSEFSSAAEEQRSEQRAEGAAAGSEPPEQPEQTEQPDLRERSTRSLAAACPVPSGDLPLHPVPSTRTFAAACALPSSRQLAAACPLPADTPAHTAPPSVADPADRCEEAASTTLSDFFRHGVLFRRERPIPFNPPLPGGRAAAATHRPAHSDNVPNIGNASKVRRPGRVADRLYLDAQQRSQRRDAAASSPPLERPRADPPVVFRREGPASVAEGDAVVTRLLAQGEAARRRRAQQEAAQHSVEGQGHRPRLSQRSEELAARRREARAQRAAQGEAEAPRQGQRIAYRGRSDRGAAAQREPGAPPPPQWEDFLSRLDNRERRRELRLAAMRKEQEARELGLCSFRPQMCPESDAILQRRAESPASDAAAPGEQGVDSCSPRTDITARPRPGGTRSLSDSAWEQDAALLLRESATPGADGTYGDPADPLFDSAVQDVLAGWRSLAGESSAGRSR